MKPSLIFTTLALHGFATALALPFGGTEAQKPLQSVASSTFELREQNDEICRAGSRQWTGTVDVTDEKTLFFWFFESRSDPKNDPVVVWLNGGPGGSSLMGLFTEMGPCAEVPDGNDTIYNEHSWTNFANVLFIDQPAGVGFSSVKNGTDLPDSLAEASTDFDKLLSVIFKDMLPQFSKNPFHIAGESFGGRYVPGFVSYISQRQQLGVPTVFQTPIESIILVDAVLDHTTSGYVGQFEHFCAVDADGHRVLRKQPFNGTACAAMEADLPECEELAKQCVDTYNKHICELASTVCASTVGKWHDSDVIIGGRDPYDDRHVCEMNPPLCSPFNSSGYVTYLNSPRVQDALGFKDFHFDGINFELNGRWSASKEASIPTTREVSYILDQTPTKILVLNGNNDVIVNTEGQRRVYDHLPWLHQASYRIQPWVDWVWPESKDIYTKGGEIKSVDKLTFASVDEAGHTSPGDQPAAVSWLVDCWVNDKPDAKCPI